MKIVDKVKSSLASSNTNNDVALSAALAEAERLSDIYAEIKPIPYIVPIERFAGMTTYRESAAEAV